MILMYNMCEKIFDSYIDNFYIWSCRRIELIHEGICIIDWQKYWRLFLNDNIFVFGSRESINRGVIF